MEKLSGILDVDRHVIEPVAMWKEYLPSAMLGWAPEVRPWPATSESLATRLETLGTNALMPTPAIPCVQGRPIYKGMSEAAYISLGLEALRRRDALTASGTAAGHLTDMDRAGIEAAILLPTYASYLVWNDDISEEVSRAYAQAYNRWLHDLRSPNKERLNAALVLSCHNPAVMVEDLERALKFEPSAIVLRPNPIRGRTLGHPGYAAFWQACQANGLPVFLHEGTHARVTTAGAERYETRFGQHACSHPLEAMMALLSLVEGGVLEAHPRLRVAVLEAGCGWLPYWLWRLDEVEYRYLKDEVGRRVRKRPSEYFREQCWIAVEPGEPLLGSVIEAIGSDRFVMGTDFPHLDHENDIVEKLRNEQQLEDGVVRRILYGNPWQLLTARVHL